VTIDQFKAYLSGIPADQRYELAERAAILEEANGWTMETAMERAVKMHKETYADRTM
jgi:hypothetical protein